MHHTLRYRPYIDGLRAIAVLGVVLFHFGADWLPGGFVGVDVFFVISGFLISRSIYGEIAEGSFSIMAFYERRIRRIVPAFVVVSLVTSVAAFLILYPGQLVAYARSLIWSTFAAGNVYFFRESDYFAPAAHELPLLHYWSLGVEEQFYLLFPALLLLCRRLRPAALPALVGALLVASLIACEVMLRVNPSAAFYLLPFRAFELLIGAALALPGLRFPRDARLAAGAVVAGLALIFASMTLLTAQSPFPGLNALAPCLGAALVIWGGESVTSLPARLLGTAPLRFFGAISYSLYLVHWPIAVFALMLAPDLPPLALLVGGTLLSTLLGWLSWRFVEQPVRRDRVFFTAKRVFGGTAATGIILIAISGVVLGGRGFPGRLDEGAQKLLAYQRYDSRQMYRTGTCFLAPGRSVADLDMALCLPQRPNVILWGSSVLAQYFAGLDGPMRARGYALGQITAASCYALPGRDIPNWPDCRAFNDFALDWLLKNRPTMVVIGGSAVAQSEDLAALDDTVRKLTAAGIEVVILGPVPFFRRNVPEILADRALRGKTDVMSDGDLIKGLGPGDAKLAAHFAGWPGVRYVSVLDAMCPGEKCRMAQDGVPYHFDVVHLTREGGDFYGAGLVDLILGRPPAR